MYLKTCTVNQLLFAMTLFCDLPEMNWFGVTDFHEQDVYYFKNNKTEIFKDWFTAKNIRDDYEALANLAKISCTRIKVGVQYADTFTHCLAPY